MSRTRHHHSQDKPLSEVYPNVDNSPLLEKLGVTLEDDHLRLALTHRSFANENGHLPNNERLELLGDAVLGLSIAGELYEHYPSRPESDLSKMRASIVSRYGLADIARNINLGNHIYLGKGEILTGGAKKDSILADTMEAIFGAIYREHGFSVARDVILRLFKEKVDNASAVGIHQDWKTELQERLAELNYNTVAYETSSVGPDHAQVFTAHAIIEGKALGEGVGPNKKTAEQIAAHHALQKLRNNKGRIDA